ncbi:oligosaccharide flippase family protein [Aliisedimentitalea scapharcae]|uniref:Oligosaccharide flippase family protein n=1 Tax=Aliisedimentitalea scapharcae TaxID=1524259 RepID=A0ABZ2XV74_9RHOB
MNRVTTAFKGGSLMARVLRSASWLMIGYGGSQALRLAANLVLARLLFPEAFGLMALVNVVILGLTLFSDTGINAAIAQSDRGDDPDFLNTAFSIQVVRGLILWATTALLAWPVSQFYNEPDLLVYLPIAGVGLAINGFMPTRVETAHRHLLVGRVTALDLISQALGILSMVVLAVITQSVIALVLGGVFQAFVTLALTQAFLPGMKNRFRWEAKAVHEQLHFGKWIFLSTACWFFTSQGDRLFLGKFVTLEVLGLYNIGFFLASFPMLLGYAINQRLLIPVYREKPATESRDNWRNQRWLRFGLSGAILSLLLVVAFAGPWLVDLLYDERYMLSGPMVSLIAIAMIPAVIGLTYDPAALAAGDSRGFFVFTASRAIIQTILFLLGLSWFGVLGGIAALGVSMLLAYPVLIWLATKHKVWDPVHDLLCLVLAGGIAGLILSYHAGMIPDMVQALGQKVSH